MMAHFKNKFMFNFWPENIKGRNRIFKIFFLLLFCIVLAPASKAMTTYQPQRADLTSAKFGWTNFQRLTGKGLSCLAQDSLQNIWFGTQTGIYRYDGHSWTHYSTEHGLPDGFLRILCVTANNRLYALYENSGLFVQKDTLWHKMNLSIANESALYHNICPVGKDSLWIASHHGAILHTGNSNILYRDESSFILPLDANEQTLLEQSRYDIYDVYEDHNENLFFIALQDTDVQLIFIPHWKKNLKNHTQWKSYPIKVQSQITNIRPKMIQSTQGDYWIYAYSEEFGLYHFAHPDSTWSFIDLSKKGGTNVVLSALETHDNKIWFGGNGYLYSFENGTLKVYRPEELGIPITGVQLLQTKDRALWLACLNAQVYRIDYGGNRWNMFEDLHFQCETANGTRYFLSREGHVIRNQSPQKTWHAFDETDGLMNMPLVVITAADGSIWSAGSHHGIAAVSRLEENKWHTDTFPDLSWSISHNAALAARDSSLWFGSISDPFGQFKGGCVVYQLVENGYSNKRIISQHESFNRISALAQDVYGRIWAAASHLLYFKNDRWQLVDHPQDLQKGWLDHVMAAGDSSLWVAKGGVGIYRIKGEQWKKFTVEDGLPSNMATFLLEDEKGVLAATDMGLGRFDEKNWTPFNLDDELRIPREYGVLKLEKNGRLWINQAARDWYFRALHDDPETSQPRFRTISYMPDNRAPDTKIDVFQKRLNKPANQYIVWHGIDPFEITPQKELTFSYRLGTDSWSPFSASNTLQLLNMKAGRYTFQVRARDRDGNIDLKPAQIRFRVLPPIWKQGWMIALLIVFSSVIIGLLISIALKNKKLIEAKNNVEEAASFKERFFMNISHEFRTPLTIILGAISSLSNGKKSSFSDKRQFNILHRHAQYLLHLVNQLLEFRRIESGAHRLGVAQADLVKLVQHTVALFKPMARDHRIICKVQTFLQSWHVWFDQKKVEMILMNLIGNALKFTPDGGKISISIDKKTLPSKNIKNGKHLPHDQAGKNNQSWAEIKISDTGIGIPPERLPHIFDRFYTVEHPGKLYYDSIGIGMDLTKELVELHKGTIKVSSTVNAGSTFTVLLPIEKAFFNENEIDTSQQILQNTTLSQDVLEEIRQERQKLTAIQVDENIGPRGNNKPLLLVAEDHPDMSSMLKSWLQNLYEIIVTEDGSQALDAAISHVPDLIISDVMMPNMDGIELTRRLKSNVITSHIPVILLTIKSKVEHRIQGIETGADAYLAKPFVREELDAIIDNLIKTRKELRKRFSRELVVKPKDITISDLDEQFLEKCIHTVEKHISDADFHINEFCREIGMSRTQAYHKVKNLSGFSLNEFILHIRLKRAAQLVAESQMNISEIAYSLGFCDHAHFSRHFKRTFGCPPKEYRNKQRQSE